MSPRERATVNRLVGVGLALVWIGQGVEEILPKDSALLHSLVTVAEMLGVLFAIVGAGVWVNARQGASERPALLGAIVMLSTLVVLVVIPMLLLPILGTGTFFVNGQPATNVEFLTTAGPALVALLAIVAAVLVAIHKGAPVSRPLIVVPVTLALGARDVFVALHRELTILQVGASVGLVGLLVWYFYFKKSVTTYYSRAAV